MIEIKGQNTANSHPHPFTNKRYDVHAVPLAWMTGFSRIFAASRFARVSLDDSPQSAMSFIWSVRQSMTDCRR